MNENLNLHNSQADKHGGGECATNELEKRIETLQDRVEDILEELVDLEEYAKKKCAPPKARAYRIRIANQKYTVEQQRMTGAEILILAGLDPKTNRLQQKINGAPKTVKNDEVVDFSTPGIERFMTLPLDQNDGGF